MKRSSRLHDSDSNPDANRPKRERKPGDTFSMEEQQQLEKALRASLAQHKSPVRSSSNLLKISPSGEQSTSANVPSSPNVFEQTFLPKVVPTSPVPTRPTADRQFRKTEDFLRYLCFRDTDFMPQNLASFGEMPLESFSIKGDGADQSPVVGKAKRRLETNIINSKRCEVDTKTRGGTDMTEKLAALRRRLNVESQS